MNQKLRFLFALALVAFPFTFCLAQGNFTSNTATGNWNVNGSWTLNSGTDADGVPDSNDNVTIATGHQINVNVASACSNLTFTNGSGIINFSNNFTLAVGGNLIMDGTSQIISDASNTSRILTVAGTFTVASTASGLGARLGNATNGFKVTISGATTINGSFSILNDTWAKVFAGSVTVASTGTWVSTAVTSTANLEFRNGLSNSGSFSAGGATFSDATTNTQTIGGTGAMSFSGVVTLLDGAVAGALSVTNNNTNTLTISGTGAAQLTGTAGASWIQGANSTLSYAGSTITSITLNASTNTPNTVIYTGATPTIVAVNYNSLTFSGATSASLANQSISGNLTVNNGAFTSGTNLTFNGTSTQTIGGTSGSITLTVLTISLSGGGDLNINRSITLSGAAGTLNFTASNNRKIVLGTSGNITLSNTAGTITNYDSDSYVQADGLSGSNGNLIFTTANSLTSSWLNEFPVGTSTGGYNPLDIGSLGGVAPAANATLSVKTIHSGSNQGQLRRVFRMTVASNGNATFFSSGVFNYDGSLTTDISSGDAEANYTTGWYLKIPNGSWGTAVVSIDNTNDQFTVTGGSVTDANLATGIYYYTLGAATAYPNTWYTYQTGVWSNYLNWTLDPSGSTLSNPLGLPPVPGDQIVILNGYTITNDANTQTASTTTINNGGTLDMYNTTGNTLGTVSGTGILRMKGVNLPSGTYTSFVSTSGGTIEYYDESTLSAATGGGDLPASQTTYNKLKLTNTASSSATFSTTANLTVNGTFEISGSTALNFAKWQINKTGTTQLAISLLGDLTLNAGGRIGVGTGAPGGGPHALTMSANITNSGVIKFFDETDTDFLGAYLNSASAFYNTAQNNSVNVTYSNTGDNTITSTGTTDLYRLIVNKGTGPGAVLEVNSSAVGNFRIYGPANHASPSISLQNGTLKLSGSMSLGYLVLTNGDYTIPNSAGLWLNGSGVTVTGTDNSTKGGFNYNLFLNGILRITAGTYNGGSAPGLIAGDEGSLIMDGADATSGLLNVWQLRGQNPSSGNFNYVQSGGTVDVAHSYALDGANNSGSYARFALGSSTATFSMTGGILNVAKAASDGGIVIGSGSSYYTVTGGTVNIYEGPQRTTSDQPFTISTTVPFYNVNIYRENLQASTTAAVLQTSLTVLNNFTIDNDLTQTPTLTCNNNNVTIGGNFTIESTTTFTPGTNTITFNGSGAQTWTYAGTITSLNNIVVNKSAGTTLTLVDAALPNIAGGLTITSGTLADGGETINITGSVLSNSGTHTSPGSGSIIVAAASTVATIGGSNGTFGNLTLSRNATITTSGNQTVTGNLRLSGASTSLDIGSYALVASGNIYDDATTNTSTAFSATKRIITSGLHNAGGLTRSGNNGLDVLFPVGTSTIGYTPATINVSAAGTGTITVRNVNAEHPNVTNSPFSLQYYWRVTSSGYSSITSVLHKDYTFSTATRSAASGTNYRIARYDGTTFSWDYTTAAYDATTGAGTTKIPNFNTGSGWTTLTSDKLDGDYTCGTTTPTNAFAIFQTYYSRASTGWSVNSTWSNIGVGNATPSASNPTSCNNCPVVIGNASNFHEVEIDANSQGCGSLSIYSGSALDCNTFTSLDFGTYVDATVNGTLKINSTQFPAGDFTTFIGTSGGTVEWYGAAKTIPATGNAPQNLNLATYYNITISPNAGADITLPQQNSLTVYNDFTVSGLNSTTSRALNNTTGGTTRTITINGQLRVTLGKLYISEAASLNFTVTGLTTINANSFFQLNAAGTRVHSFTTSSGITNNGTLDFNGGTNVMNLTLTGSSNVSLSGGGSGDFNLITVNKGTNSTPTATLSMTTATAPSTDWLTLTNGTFDFASATGTYSLETNGDFTIGSTTKLKVSSGTVNIISAGTGDLFLNGELEVGGGIATVANGTNGNDIEYAAAGTPKITVSGGSLNVNGQIRRSSTSTTGALNYTQTAGSVTVGGQNPLNTRGVFEIDNTGSNFTFTGGTLTIERDTDGTGYADLYLNPETSNVSSPGTIVLGVSSDATNNIRIDVKPAIGNLTIVGTTAQTVTMYNNPLVLGGTLTINTPSTLVTQSLDVTIAGNLVCTGTYTGGTNTTTFNGSDAQSAALTASSTFNNITINNSGTTPDSDRTVTLSGTSPSLNNLNILSGILDVGSLNLAVNGNIVNNSSQVASGGGYIILSSTATAHTITSSNGSFANLRLAPVASFPATSTITVNGNTTINGNLDFNTTATNVYFFIGGNLLTFTSTATVSNSGSNRFIKTNGVSSDLGVLRNWLTGTGSFTYAVGTRVNYTPVIFTNMVVGTAGTLKVVPVDDPHPTQDNSGNASLLNYYWSLTSSLTPSGNGTVVFQAPTLLIGGTGGTLFGAYLDVNNLDGTAGSGWDAPIGTVNASILDLTITNGLDTYVPQPASNRTQYDYAIGDPSRLPATVTFAYSRFSDNGGGNATTVSNLATGGNWTDASSWTLENDGTGAALTTAPTNRPVTVLSGARINMNANFQTAPFITLSGLLYVPSTVGHNIGTITGTGTLRSANSVLPAGTFTAFVATGGGTIEYDVANMATPTMNNRATYNNLTAYGSSGTLTMTASDITVNGNLTIDLGVTLSNSVNDADIAIAGNWINNGTFTAGAGLVTFNGTTAQSITGSQTFSGLTINKASGNVTMTSSNTVSSILTLTSGHISTSGNTLALGSSTVSGGSSNSFIDGPITKVVADASSFSAPLGSVSVNRYRPVAIANTNGPDPDSWSFQYVGTNPTLSGYDISLKNGTSTNTNSALPLGTVSAHEFWLISRTGGTTADLTLSYGTGSYNPPDIGVVGNLRVARWDIALIPDVWDYPPGNGTFLQSGSATAGTISITNVTNFSPVTIASTDLNSPLPIELLYFTGKLKPEGVQLDWKTATEIENDYFTVEKSVNGEKFSSIGKVAGAGTSAQPHEYRLLDTKPFNGVSYYRLKQTDFNGKSTTFKVISIEYHGDDQVSISIYPNPATGLEVTIEVSGLKEIASMPISITDPVGRELISATMEVENGFLTKRLSTENMASGVYILKIGTLVRRIVIAR